MKEHWKNEPGVLEDSLDKREKRMNRFAEYFTTIFHQQKLNPFIHFIDKEQLKAVKMDVREKMDYYTRDEEDHSSDD